MPDEFGDSLRIPNVHGHREGTAGEAGWSIFNITPCETHRVEGCGGPFAFEVVEQPFGRRERNTASHHPFRHGEVIAAYAAFLDGLARLCDPNGLCHAFF